MHHEIDLLLKCKDIYIEPIEAAVFIPQIGEHRFCKKHGEQEVVKVGIPYWIDKEKENEKAMD